MSHTESPSRIARIDELPNGLYSVFCFATKSAEVFTSRQEAERHVLILNAIFG